MWALVDVSVTSHRDIKASDSSRPIRFESDLLSSLTLEPRLIRFWGCLRGSSGKDHNDGN